MCIEDIKTLPVGELAAKDCALFLWITFPCLCEALEVLTAWGFSYKTVAFVWVKQNRKNDDLFTGMVPHPPVPFNSQLLFLQPF